MNQEAKDLAQKLERAEQKIRSLEAAIEDMGALIKYGKSSTGFLVIASDGCTVVNGRVFNPIEVIEANRKLIAERDEKCKKLREENAALKKLLKIESAE